MKFILRTCALFLILPWKLTCETNLRPSSTSQHEDTNTRADNSTTFSPKDTEQPLKANNETTYSPSSSILLKSTITDHETTVRAEEPTTFSLKYLLKTNDKTTYNPSSTWLLKGTSKDDETIIRADKYTTKENENNLSSETLPQTSEHQGDTSLSHVKYVTYAMTVSTGESRSSSHLSSPPFPTELPQKKRTTPTPQAMSKEVITTRDDRAFYQFKSTNKGLDRYTQGNRTTRLAEKESSTPQTGISTHFQKTPEVITNQSGVEVHTTETLTTEWSSLPQEKESTQPPILNITDSNGTLNISNEERNDTATDPLNTTTTAFSTGLGLTVDTEGGTTDTTDIKATYEITTKEIINDIKSPKTNSETTPMSQTNNEITTPKSPVKVNNNKSHPGPVIASLIGSILFLMFVAFVVVLVRNRQMRKKKMENTDWAGPSPFIESDIQPNLPTINEEGPFYRSESKKISLQSFLPNRLSKRLSVLSPTDEEVPFEDIEVSSRFGQEKVQPLNGKATPDQIQTHEANSSPEVSTDSNVPENLRIPSTPENNKTTQAAPKSEKEIILSPPEETNCVTPTSFEDVDLNAFLDKNAESTSPSDAIHIPSPPPLPPS